ncbi:MAG: acyltransferase [Lachnospiraceae bacterium]|nr:acyltransferase [Lachnospiraceae bacterium]
MEKRTRLSYKGLDILRIICAVFVVTIHFQPFGPSEAAGMLNFRFVQYFSRNAVPLFFIISSFFLFNKTVSDGRIDMGAVLRKCWEYYRLYLIWTVIYLFMIIKSYTHGRKTVLELIRDFFFCGSYLHLWYLPALITGILIVALLIKAGLKKRTVLLISCFLYLIALLGHTYFNLLAPLRKASDTFDTIQSVYFKIFYTTRNGVFEVPLFVCLGYLLSEKEKNGSDKRIKDHILPLLLFFALEVAEAELVHAFGLAREADFYITTPLLCFVIFEIFKGIGTETADEEKGKYRFMRDCASYMYFVQMYVGMAVKDVLDIFYPAKTGKHYLFLPVLAGSFLVSCVIIRCSKILVNRRLNVV